MFFKRIQLNKMAFSVTYYNIQIKKIFENKVFVEVGVYLPHIKIRITNNICNNMYA